MLDDIGWSSSNRNWRGIGSTFVDKVGGNTGWDWKWHFQKYDAWLAEKHPNSASQPFDKDKYREYIFEKDVKINAWVDQFGYKGGKRIMVFLGVLQFLKTGWGWSNRGVGYDDLRTGDNTGDWKHFGGSNPYEEESVTAWTPPTTGADIGFSQEFWDAWNELPAEARIELADIFDNPELVDAEPGSSAGPFGD